MSFSSAASILLPPRRCSPPCLMLRPDPSVLCPEALEKALRRRKPEAGLIFHSDRGTQYASYAFRDLLDRYGFVQSMSSTGHCYDNGLMESFFHTLKTELIYFEKYRTRQEARGSVFEYIEISYNRTRRHSSLNYCSPAEFEKRASEA